MQIDPFFRKLLVARADRDAGDIHGNRLAFDWIGNFNIRIACFSITARKASEFDRDIRNTLVEHAIKLILAALDGGEGF